MEGNTINKEAKKRSVMYSRLKRKIMSRHVGLVRAVLMIVVGLVVLGAIVFTNKLLNNNKYVSLAKAFLFTPEGIAKEIDGRTNILLLGKAGEGHIAPDLTDTMILMSIDHNQEEITLISLPRDIWITELRTKLNSTYYWGNKRQENGGLILAKATVEEVTGVPIQYGAVVDFNGFSQFIDKLGGIEVDVTHGFIDREFPIPGKENDECDGDLDYKCRYETIEFKEGVNRMNGETALKFVRSRHSEDELEGTDFGRAARQRLVIEAIIQRAQERDIIFSYAKLKELFNYGISIVETDIDTDAAAVIARRGYESRDSIRSVSFPEELLVNPPIQSKYDNLYVFVPDYEVEGEPSFNRIHEWFEGELD